MKAVLLSVAAVMTLAPGIRASAQAAPDTQRIVGVTPVQVRWFVPAGLPHFVATKNGAVIVQLNGTGKFATDYLEK
jgi:hypothetical protein